MSNSEPLKSQPYKTGDGRTVWIGRGIRHRTDGPAMIYENGSTEWWVEGRLHREDGPAVQYVCGLEKWYFMGQRHCLSGPAVVNKCGCGHADAKCYVLMNGSQPCTEYWVYGQRIDPDYYYRFIDTTHREILIPQGHPMWRNFDRRVSLWTSHLLTV